MTKSEHNWQFWADTLHLVRKGCSCHEVVRWPPEVARPGIGGLALTCALGRERSLPGHRAAAMAGQMIVVYAWVSLKRAASLLRLSLVLATILYPTMIWAEPPDKSGVKPSAISLPRGAGSIEGLGESFEPQLNTGGSSYGVSISVPPGRAGLAPTIRLGYNSFSGNGLAGIGWSLEFSSVKRQTDKGFPEYDSGDTFVFGGEELVPLNNAGQDWRCENERSFQRLRRIDSDGDGLPDAWEVTERNGTRHTLGRFRGQNGRWSVVENPEKLSSQPFDRTYSWELDSTTDLHGNRIEYEYIKGTGVLYPSRITYAHLSNNFHEVTFQYESRPDAFDDYRPAFVTRLSARLSRIEVRSRGQLVRAYDFMYSYEPGDLTPSEVALQSTYLDLGVTLLKRVVQLDNSGNEANHLPPLVFTYSGLDLTKAELRGFAAFPELDLAEPNGRVQVADLDGDALPDLFATTTEGATTVQRVALNRGESRLSGQPKLSFAASKLVLGSSPVDLADPNTVVHDAKGKGLVDMSSLADEGGNKRLETFGNRARLDSVDENRLGFSQENLEATVLANPPAFVTYSQSATRQMDVNFDKRGDFVNLEPGFAGMTVNSFFVDRAGNWVPGESTLPASYPLANTFQDIDGNPNPCVHLADMNGDRLLDLVCLSPSPSGGGQRIRVSYWPLSGRGRYGDEHVVPTTDPDQFDIGNADLKDVFLEDITGDGLADVLILDGSGPETVLTLRVNIAGQRWSPPYTRTGLPRYAPRDASQPTIVRLADLNANGSLDILFRNTSPESSWSYLEMLPQGAPNLMIGMDNGIGKRTSIVYGSAAEDEQLARESGHPWKTFAPIALQVVREIRTTSGLDLNGDGKQDTMVMRFRYRDPYYDGLEREFRGFAFAQRVDYGDDFLFDPVTGLMQVSAGWDPAHTPTGQRSGPSLVTRYRFYTGAADQMDNDDYGGAPPPPDKKIDEITPLGGREEEPLKGLEVVQEKVDPVVLHSAVDGAFDAGGEAAAIATTPEGQGKLTPDAYVYTRNRQSWTIRRLYRPTEALPYLADQNADGILEDYRDSPAVLVPQGRFASSGISVLNGSGRSVSFVFLSSETTEVREANGLLSVELGQPAASGATTTETSDYDDYGNLTVHKEFGLSDPAFDDERVTTTTYALGGNALSLWVINKPDAVTVTDENGAFVSKKINFYDAEPYVGVQGQIQDRGLLNRTVEYVDPARTIQASRSRFDAYGNIEEMHDPVGNIRRVAYDPNFKTQPVTETMVVGGGLPDLVMEADYDYGFGVVTSAKDFNGRLLTYTYDSFGRLVKMIRPGDTPEVPTTVYEYQPIDPVRGRGFMYDASGNLTVTAVPLGSASRVITREREASGLPGQFITVSYTDGSGKQLASLEEGDVAGTWVVKQAVSYNLRGQALAQWLPYQISGVDVPYFSLIWPNGRPPAVDGTNQVVSTDLFYDPIGRQIRSINPPETWGGERRETKTHFLPFQGWTYDEEDTRLASPYAGTPHIAISDGLGRIVSVAEVVRLDDQGGSISGTNHWVTMYGYDLNDQLTRVIDSRNNVKTMQYDGLKRKILSNDPDQGISRYVYDDASNLIETTDAKGQRITYTYDGVKRIRTEEYHDESSPEFSYHRSPDVQYFYDQPAGPLDQGDGTTATARNTKGLLAYVVDATGEEHTSYDDRGRPEWTTKRIVDASVNGPLSSLSGGSLVSYTTRFNYDGLDRVTRMVYPDNDEVNYQYTERSLLRRVAGGPSSFIISSIAYRSSGQQQEVQYGNGVRTTSLYDPRLRLTDLVTVAPPSGQGQELINFHYDFDGVSNIRNIQDRRAAGVLPTTDKRRNSQTFTYDDLYRLTRAQYNLPAGTSANGGEISYRYDRLGNLVSQSSDIVALDRGLSVTQLGAMSYGGGAGTANRNGRASGDPPGPHALTSVQPPSTVVRSYPYDGNGNMAEIDGLRCKWDFKDRLVEIEDDTMRAEYRYDYTDRRVVKRVWAKPGTNAQPAALPPAPSVSLYASKHFEVRPDEQPTKYIFDGQSRVARIIGSVSSNPRVQRLRLEPGWNLRSIAVGGARLPSNVHVDAAFKWRPATFDWAAVSDIDSLTAGSVLWIHAKTNTTLPLMGIYTDPTNQLVLAAGSFVGGTGLETWSFSTNSLNLLTSAWNFDAFNQNWQIHGASFATSISDLPRKLQPGGAMLLRAASDLPLQAPDPALRVCYYHQDHLGSSSVVTDSNGSLVEENAFFPFGASRNQHLVRQVEDFYSFSQKERDDENHLQYFETRYLAGPLSRFITVDRKYAECDQLSPADLAGCVAQPQKFNLYAYCNNNPLRYVDPDGRDGAAIGVSVQVEGGIWGNGAVEVGPTVFTPKASEAWKIWKYDIGLCGTVGVGVGTPGGSVSVNGSVNLGGRSSYEGPSRTTSVSGPNPIPLPYDPNQLNGSYSQTSGDPTYSVGVGWGIKDGPPVGVSHRQSYTKCFTVKDALSAVTSPFKTVKAVAPKIDIPVSREELSISSRSVAYIEPPPPPRPQPKHTPRPVRQPRARQECWTRGVPP